MTRPIPELDTSLVSTALTETDPVSFVLSEDLVVFATKARVPQLKPSTVVFSDRWRTYKRRKDMVGEMEEWLDEQWMQLTKAIVTEQINTTLWTAGEALRNMVWAEQLRREAEHFRQQMRFEYHRLDLRKKQLELEDAMAKTGQLRTHGLQKELLDLQRVHEKEMEALKLGQTDPVVRVARFHEAFKLLKPDLRKISKSKLTTAVKNEISQHFVDAIKRSIK